jgi:hypothetical protein
MYVGSYFLRRSAKISRALANCPGSTIPSKASSVRTHSLGGFGFLGVFSFWLVLL